jgi:hypothetical protein
MKRFFKNNGLSVVLAFFFFLFWSAQAVAGWKVHNHDQVLHGASALTFGAYLLSGHFWGATGENWESEFLQMGAYVILTCFLFQKGSAESKDPDEPEADESHSKTPKRRHSFLYRNSLFIAFILLFLGSFAIHAKGGLIESNEERAENGESAQTLPEFLTDSEFWFQSFQNWQSEFLAVFSIVTLTIFLRQDGSPESKSVDSPNSKTGD